MALAVLHQSDTGGQIASGSSGTVLPTNGTIGNLAVLAVLALISTTNDVSAITGICTTWTRASGLGTVGISGDLETWSGTITSAASAITVTTTGAVTWSAQGTEVTGSVGSVITGGTASGTSASTSLTVSGVANGDLVLVLAANAGSFTGGPSSPWVDYDAGSFTFAQGVDTAYQVVTATSVTATWSAGSSLAWVAVGIVVVPAGGAAPFALVGTIGAVSVGASGAAVTPAFGTGESRTLNNLLILWVTSQGTVTLPAAPSGWSIAKQQAGTSCSSSIFYKVASGGDTAPTVAAVTSSVLSCQLAEFSGGAVISPLDQTAGTAGTTSTQTATVATTDVAVGELLIVCAGNFYSSSSGTKTGSVTSNNATLTTTTNQGAAITDLYALAYGVTTSNAAADNAVFTFSITHETGAAMVVASFKLFSVFSLAQSPSTSIASSASSPLTLAVAAPKVGQLLIAGFGYWTNGTAFTVSVTDNGSGGWLPIQLGVAGSTIGALWWYKVASATDVASLTTLTFSWSGGSNVMGGGSLSMDEYHGFVGAPVLDLNPTVTSVNGISQTITGGVAAFATELALGFYMADQGTGAVTGTNTYSPNNGTTTYTWVSTVSSGTSNTVRTWAPPTAAPATASVWKMAWTSTHNVTLVGATFHDSGLPISVVEAPRGMTQAVHRAAHY